MEFFSRIFKKIFREDLLLLVHVITRGKQRVIINERIHLYLNKSHTIYSSGKARIHQRLQRIFFSLCTCHT